jgi:hypothetical protein
MALAVSSRLLCSDGRDGFRSLNDARRREFGTAISDGCFANREYI